ncbi:hypothetical protein LEP1GSC050_0489 [Leptospira broomii serovar Hurstbridge str. 5399]|uniref:Uncharacterized protein n=1 Tax=Leptospira broomii serovar Hurstbridge str. 5399 TaxID=1049789 RepID=T0GLV5_9LEPT|nr:hypothetical protein [Leptospira broomii]EQA46348.1 hypothetical protein LEP1GSC050_0489 [Leptospira broomii serovar Hurstbridge str. 5399]
MAFRIVFFRSRKSRVYDWLTQPGRLEESFRRSLHFLFDSSLEELLPENIRLSPSLVGLVRLPEEKIQILSEEFPIEKAFPHTSFDEFLSEETREALVELIAGTQAAPSKNLILGILNLPEVQDILSQGLEKVLTEFHKKINPLHGVFQAAGLEKQVSQFLSSLLPAFTERIADFVSIGSGAAEVQSALRNTLRLLFKTGFAEMGRVDGGQIGPRVDRLRRAVASDLKVQSALENLYATARDTLLNHYRKETIREFLGLSTTELELWIGKVAEDAAHNLREVNKKRNLSPLILEILKDILG